MYFILLNNGIHNFPLLDDDSETMKTYQSELDATLAANEIIENNDEGYEAYEIYELGAGCIYFSR